MRALLTAALAGTAFTLIGAAALPAAGQTPTHAVAVQLPNGTVEQIVYAGDVAPRFVLVPVAAPAFPMADPFAMLDRMSALLDQQAANMLGTLADVSTPAATLAPGTVGTTFVATFSSDGVCTRSVRITYDGNGAAPRKVSSSSGNCAGEPRAQVPTEATQPRLPEDRPAMPRTIEVKATHPPKAQKLATPSPTAYRQLVEPTAWQP